VILISAVRNFISTKSQLLEAWPVFRDRQTLHELLVDAFAVDDVEDTEGGAFTEVHEGEFVCGFREEEGGGRREEGGREKGGRREEG
jgi:hypothetical protein